MSYYSFIKLLKKHGTGTGTIKEAPDSGKNDCEIFVHPQKAFGTAEHNILLRTLKRYGITGVAYSWFESRLY